MKKLFPIFLILSLFTVCIIGSAMADEFSLRSDIHFGDSKETVLSKETTLSQNNSPMYKDSDTDIGFTGTLSTIPNSKITMYFSNDDRLTGMFIQYNYLDNYYNNDSKAYSRVSEEYSKIEEGLERKYGTPTAQKKQLDVTGHALSTLLSEIYWHSQKGNWLECNQWVIKVNDYYVKIEHVSGWCGEKTAMGDKNYFHFLSYDYYTDSALNSIKEMENTINSYVDDDL